MHWNNSLSTTVPWTPGQVWISHMASKNISGPHMQKKFPVSKILPVQGTRHTPAKQIHSISYCTTGVLPPPHKRRYDLVAVLFWVQRSPFRSSHEGACAQGRTSSNCLPMKSQSLTQLLPLSSRSEVTDCSASSVSDPWLHAGVLVGRPSAVCEIRGHAGELMNWKAESPHLCK